MLVTHWEFDENKLKTLWEQDKSSTPIFPQKKIKNHGFLGSWCNEFHTIF
jgi:hypothetical protein